MNVRLFRNKQLLRNVLLPVIFSLCVFAPRIAAAQDTAAAPALQSPAKVVNALPPADKPTKPAHEQKDIIDVVRKVLKGTPPRTEDEAKSKKLKIAAIPAAGYTLVTGVALVATANAIFYADTSANMSTIVSSLSYTQYSQIIFPLKSNIWTKGNKYNFSTDWRYLKYPSYTYGLGGNTKLSDGYLIDYSVVRLHQTLLRKVAKDMYAGLGYSADIYWDITETKPPAGTVTDFQKYGLNKRELESGIILAFLYDTRRNPINPPGGAFVNIIYTPNLEALGNKTTWHSLVIDLRKYIKFPAGSQNVLALWNFEWLTPSGKPPYLMLPNTGGDPYSFPGRGFIQGRFRGNNMAYVEGEYRFGISRSGLLGGVVFANAESFTGETGTKFGPIAPAYGAGLRIKVNKFSRTNVSVDYGFGAGGSQGLFVNLGEIF